MTFDSEEHKKLVLKMIENYMGAGVLVDAVWQLHEAAQKAKVEVPWVPEHPPQK